MSVLAHMWRKLRGLTFADAAILSMGVALITPPAVMVGLQAYAAYEAGGFRAFHAKQREKRDACETRGGALKSGRCYVLVTP